jgi:hypothetical protein
MINDQMIFSVPGWMNAKLSDQIPVRAHVFGNAVMKNGQKRKFDHMYEFSYLNLQPQGVHLYDLQVRIRLIKLHLIRFEFSIYRASSY